MKLKLLSCLVAAVILSPAVWAQTSSETHPKKSKHHHSSHHRAHKSKGKHSQAPSQPSTVTPEPAQPATDGTQQAPATHI